MNIFSRMLRWIIRLTPARISFYIMLMFLVLFVYKERGKLDTLELIEVKAYDLRFQAMSGLSQIEGIGQWFTPEVSDDVVIAVIDNRTLEYLDWPFPRAKWAEFMRKMQQYQPAVVAFDVVFESPGEYEGLKFVRDVADKYEELGMAELPRTIANDPDARAYQQKVDAFREFITQRELEADQDRMFARELAKMDNVVLGYFGYNFQEEAKVLTQKDLEHGAKLLDRSKAVMMANEGVTWPHIIHKLRRQRFFGFRPPVDVLANENKHFGSFVSLIDSVDGTIRLAPMVYVFTLDEKNATADNSYIYPSLSLEALRVWFKAGNPIVTLNSNGVEKMTVGNAAVPTDEKGQILINWMGPAFRTFRYVSIWDILTDFKEQTPDPYMEKINPALAVTDPARDIKGKIVLVGSSATGAHDMRTTPFGSTPGVEMHANIISNIIEGNALIAKSWFKFFDLLFILGVGILFGIVIPRVSAVWGGIVALIFLLGYSAVNVYLFVVPHYSFTIVFPLAEILFIYTGVTIFRYATEEREKRFIKNTFEHYLSPAVIDDLMKDPTKLKLGGERKELTAFFSDIQGFSSFSEAMQPEQLVHFLNIYLTEMCDLILRHDGTIDKFEGDAIIAFFGAPIDLPDHAARGVECAAEIQKRMITLRAEWKEQGYPEVYMRIGVNSGPMVVGNMGSRDRFDYTIMGDAVNLASRLESGAKQYRVYTMISEDSRALAGDVAEYRELDEIRVKGKEQPVKVYEVLGRKGEVDAKKLEVAALFEEGLKLYRDRYWGPAMNKFMQALELDPHDGPSHVFVARCEEFNDHPPGPGWDGVYTMTSK